MSAIIYQFAEEKAKRLSLRNRTQVSSVNRLLGRKETDCGQAMLNFADLLRAQRQFHQQDND